METVFEETPNKEFKNTQYDYSKLNKKAEYDFSVLYEKSNEEMIACKKIGRARAVIVTAIIISTAILGIDEISKGSTMGIALTAVMLCLGHIFDRRISK